MKIIRTKTKKADGVYRLTIMQAVFAIILILFMIYSAKKAPEIYDKLRSELGVLFSEDADIAGVFIKTDETAAEEETDVFPAEYGAVSVIQLNCEQAEGPSDALSELSFYDAAENAVLPVNGVVSSEYGSRVHPIYGTVSFHSGRDIAADEGSDIHAALDGKVIAVGIGENSGNYIKTECDGGIVILYCHCSEIYASEGQSVRKGDVIAAVGHTGLATGPHLHFEVRINGELADPSFLLDTAVKVE